MKHWELMQYANVFLSATKLLPAEIEAHIARETTSQSPAWTLRVQAYRNVLRAQEANTMAAIADVVVGPVLEGEARLQARIAADIAAKA